jgi:hypothetical protein
MLVRSKQIELDTDVTLSADSDIVIASQKAIKAYVDSATSNVAKVVEVQITGNDITTTFTVQHNLGTNTVSVNVYEDAAPNADVFITVSRPNINNVDITFAVAPVNGVSYNVVIMGTPITP